jgi:hypothetical protein
MMIMIMMMVGYGWGDDDDNYEDVGDNTNYKCIRFIVFYSSIIHLSIIHLFILIFSQHFRTW